jgi:hypothetical protein
MTRLSVQCEVSLGYAVMKWLSVARLSTIAPTEIQRCRDTEIQRYRDTEIQRYRDTTWVRVRQKAGHSLVSLSNVVTAWLTEALPQSTRSQPCWWLLAGRAGSRKGIQTDDVLWHPISN